MARTKFSDFRDEVTAKPGAAERLAALRSETLDEIQLYELRHGEAVSQAELAGRLEVTQGAIFKLEHSEDAGPVTAERNDEVRTQHAWIVSPTWPPLIGRRR